MSCARYHELADDRLKWKLPFLHIVTVKELLIMFFIFIMVFLFFTHWRGVTGPGSVTKCFWVCWTCEVQLNLFLMALEFHSPSVPPPLCWASSGVCVSSGCLSSCVVSPCSAVSCFTLSVWGTATQVRKCKLCTFISFFESYLQDGTTRVVLKICLVILMSSQSLSLTLLYTPCFFCKLWSPFESKTVRIVFKCCFSKAVHSALCCCFYATFSLTAALFFDHTVNDNMNDENGVDAAANSNTGHTHTYSTGKMDLNWKRCGIWNYVCDNKVYLII